MPPRARFTLPSISGQFYNPSNKFASFHDSCRIHNPLLLLELADRAFGSLRALPLLDGPEELHVDS